MVSGLQGESPCPDEALTKTGAAEHRKDESAWSHRHFSPLPRATTPVGGLDELAPIRASIAHGQPCRLTSASAADDPVSQDTLKTSIVLGLPGLDPSLQERVLAVGSCLVQEQGASHRVAVLFSTCSRMSHGIVG